MSLVLSFFGNLYSKDLSLESKVDLGGHFRQLYVLKVFSMGKSCKCVSFVNGKLNTIYKDKDLLTKEF